MQNDQNQDDRRAKEEKLLSRLRNNEITRKEFLLMMGGGLAGVFGLDYLTHLIDCGSGHGSQTDGYGSDAYGGSEDYPRRS